MRGDHVTLVVAATTFSPKVCYRVGGVGPIWSRDLDWLGAGYAPNPACSAILVVLLLLYHWGIDKGEWLSLGIAMGAVTTLSDATILSNLYLVPEAL